MREMTIIIDLITNMGLEISNIVVDSILGPQDVPKSDEFIEHEKNVADELKKGRRCLTCSCKCDSSFGKNKYCYGCGGEYDELYCLNDVCMPKCNWCAQHFCTHCMVNDNYCFQCEAIISHLTSRNISDKNEISKFFEFVAENQDKDIEEIIEGLDE